MPTILTPRMHVLAFAAALSCASTFAAQVDANDYRHLNQVAQSEGSVRVLVSLDDSLTLANLADRAATLPIVMERKAKALLAELGDGALTAGYWTNGIGQIGFYATPKGLQILAKTNNAKMFMPDVTQAMRTQAFTADGGMEAVDAAIRSQGYVDAEVVLNLDNLEYSLDVSGTTTVKPSALLTTEVTDRLVRIASHGGLLKGLGKADLATVGSNSFVPAFTTRLDRNAFNALKDSADVRAIRPVGFQDTRLSDWNSNALTVAKNNGSVEVLITLRGGATYSPKSGHMSAQAWKAQAQAHQQVFNQVLAHVSNNGWMKSASTDSGLGVVHARLSYDELSTLFAKADPRILRVELNRPVAKASLSNSTPLIGMPTAWNAGYRGAGQYVIVLDTGIRKDHEMFKMNGVSKVVYEACFGSNYVNPAEQANYASICPSANAEGDSPLGLVGSGEPYVNPALCEDLGCAHGTHVAGIAAGRNSASVSPANLQGVAPDANLVAVQVFSYDAGHVEQSAFLADILGALNAVYSATAAGQNNPFVVNMSLGGDTSYDKDCPTAYQVVTTVIDNLVSRGVPVVVATGNESHRNGIGWPACVPKTIKVSSVANDSAGTSLSSFSNIGNPSSYTGPTLLAPGGGSTSTVVSASSTSSTATVGYKGTSMATPHVAGYYAAIKAAIPGISVADATAWISTTGSIGVSYNLPAPVGNQAYRRIKVPNL
jgi:subtilisin family serine protease